MSKPNNAQRLDKLNKDRYEVSGTREENKVGGPFSRNVGKKVGTSKAKPGSRRGN